MKPKVEKSSERGLPPETRLWDFLFPQKSGKSVTNDPIRCEVPALRAAEIAAVYYDQRRAGDFYEFIRVGRSRLLFALLDVAGRRADTREILRCGAEHIPGNRSPALCTRGFQRNYGHDGALPCAESHHLARRDSRVSGLSWLLQRGSGHPLLCQRRSYASASARQERNHTARGDRPALRFVLACSPGCFDLRPAPGRGAAGRLAWDRRGGVWGDRIRAGGNGS